MVLMFDNFVEEHKLSPTLQGPAQLQVLQAWVEQHVSRDIYCEGEVGEQYAQYYVLAKTYFEGFLPLFQQASPERPENWGVMVAWALDHGYERIVEQLPAIESRLINAADANGMTALHKAAVDGRAFMVEALLSKGAQVGAFNAQRQTALVSTLFLPMFYGPAIIGKKRTIFQALAQAAPETLQSQDISGDNILHHLASSPFTDLFDWAINRDPSMALLPNLARECPIHKAIRAQQAEHVALLLEVPRVSGLLGPEQRSILHYAALYGDAKTVETCLQKTEDINRLDRGQETPLLLAVRANNIAALEALLKIPDIDFAQGDYQRQNILHRAIIGKSPKLVTWLASHLEPEIWQSLLEQPDIKGQRPEDHARACQGPMGAALLEVIRPATKLRLS